MKRSTVSLSKCWQPLKKINTSTHSQEAIWWIFCMATKSEGRSPATETAARNVRAHSCSFEAYFVRRKRNGPFAFKIKLGNLPFKMFPTPQWERSPQQPFTKLHTQREKEREERIQKQKTIYFMFIHFCSLFDREWELVICSWCILNHSALHLKSPQDNKSHFKTSFKFY